ncbi:MAG: hypothetical protein CBC83_09830 [Flavobacteriales bacterium TMED123]|nr:MAG: hypothetical protein CBC83_09830 [Flavobacteriales bacterium TMED123]
MKFYLIYISLLSLPFNSLAQATLDTIHLPEVLLNESKAEAHAIGGRTERINPILLGKSNTQLLSDYLTKNGSVYVKQYGALATPSFRGTSSSHTLFLWNDIPLNSLSTGLIDLSLLPINSFNQLQIAYGSSSSIFGSGAVGGAIHLNNTVDFKQSSKINLTVERGSFGLAAHQIDLKHVSSRHFFKLIYNKLEYENNFTFINTTRVNRPLENYNHSSIESEHLQSVFAYKHNKNTKLEVHLWKALNSRQVPGNMTVPYSTAMQYDDANRILINTTHLSRIGKINVKFASIEEDFNYVDDPKNIDSKILAKSYIYNIDFSHYFKIATLNIGASLINNDITSNNYQNSTEKEEEKAIYTSLQTHYKGFAADISLRNQIYNSSAIPLIPSLGIKQNIFDLFIIRAKSNKSFRLPTFNERFWIGLGNENLLPEDGWNTEAGLDVNIKGLQIGATIYSLKVVDWIQWTSNENGQWTPKNIKEVWSRGIECNLQYKQQIHNVECLIFTNYQYNQSTNEKGISALDNSVGKQLIYTPYHKGNFMFILKKPNFQLSINHAYNGSVFTTSDNSDFLEDYWLTDLSFLYEFSELPFNLQLKIKNMKNKRYQPYENYPAAGRTFLLTLNYIIN